MRALFVVLLLGNLTLLGWILVRPHFGQGNAPTTLAPVPQAEVQGPTPSDSPAVNVAANEGGGGTQGDVPLAEAGALAGDRPANDEGIGSAQKTICEKLGPFIEAGLGQGILQQLESSGVSGEISELDVPAPSDYWVYFPPLPSRRAAMNQLAEFQARKIDSFVITQGALINGVSLGLFTKKASALELVRSMDALGYPARIQEVFRSRREFWINVEYAADGESRQELWSDLEAQFPLMQRQIVSCR